MVVLASSSPDGLDSATQKGCRYDEAGEEIVTGTCIAQNATDHQLSDTTPLADYTVMGNEATVGLAGILGVVVTVAVAGGAFWLIARSRSTKPPADG